MTSPYSFPHASAVSRGRQLEYFTIAWNSLEGLIALIAGFFAGSVALMGFGFDSAVEVSSGAVVLWRLHQTSERIERVALRLVGLCFFALAAYVGYESISALFLGRTPERSTVGIALAAVSLVFMPILSRAKKKVAFALNSAAMAADAKQTDFCTYLSAILLGGLLFNAIFGWWWADPVAALLMVPIIGNEGCQAVHGKTCCSEKECSAGDHALR